MGIMSMPRRCADKDTWPTRRSRSTPSAPPTGANPAATPQHRPVPGGDAPATAAAAAATRLPRRRQRAQAAALRVRRRRRSRISRAGPRMRRRLAARLRAPPPPLRPRKPTARAADDTSPLLTRRAWMGLAWGAFSAASAAALAATGRFMFPNVLNEPPQQFKAGFPNEYGIGVDERWKEKFGDLDRAHRRRERRAARQRLLRAHHRLHAPRLHAELPVGGKQVQVPVPRQRLPPDRHQLRRARRRVRSSARASCWPTTDRSSSTRAGTSSTSWDSGRIRRLS